jgi:voltage-gated potassium channel
MKSSRYAYWHFWSDESALTRLFFVTLISLFFTCALGDFPLADIVTDILFSLIIITGVSTTFRQFWVFAFAIAMAVMTLTLTWMQYIHSYESLTLLVNVFKLSFLFLLLGVLFVQVFKAGSVTAHRIRGSIVIYLLLGMMWCFFYHIAFLIVPQSLHFPQGLAFSNPHALDRILTYFSFTTLTTTGFGDITPTAPLTRTLAMSEALAGQLYLVITLARLVSLAIVSTSLHRNSKE